MDDSATASDSEEARGVKREHVDEIKGAKKKVRFSDKLDYLSEGNIDGITHGEQPNGTMEVTQTPHSEEADHKQDVLKRKSPEEDETRKRARTADDATPPSRDPRSKHDKCGESEEEQPFKSILEDEPVTKGTPTADAESTDLGENSEHASPGDAPSENGTDQSAENDSCPQAEQPSKAADMHWVKESVAKPGGGQPFSEMRTLLQSK